MLENIYDLYENNIMILTYGIHSNIYVIIINGLNNNNNKNKNNNNNNDNDRFNRKSHKICFIYSIQVLDYSVTLSFLTKASVHKNRTFSAI